ncbi:ImmA/IrrE family metallo-endopeptidase [Tsukamurella sp. DT100]|uniref:ImmA/IrrE family metallo-endopeptidase n=1 Tax=Tsukamurella sp. DT100 TaxID=3393415 RepID=UPI003CF0BB81
MTTTEPSLNRWHPWRVLRDEYPDVDVVFCRFNGRRRGETDGETIWLDERLSQAQRRCVLTHELWHIRRGILPADRAEERQCDVLAARELIPLGVLIDGFRWTLRPKELATHLWVDMHTLSVRLDTLDPIEVAQVEIQTDGAWWQWR